MDEFSRKFETDDASSIPGSPSDQKRKLSIASDRSAGTEYVNVDDCSPTATPVAYSDADVCIHDNSYHDDFTGDHVDNNVDSNNDNTGEDTEYVNDIESGKEINGDIKDGERYDANTDKEVNTEPVDNNRNNIQYIGNVPGSFTTEGIEFTAPNGGSSSVTNKDQTSCETNNSVNQTDSFIGQNSGNAGIIYDETKPKRLPNRKKMHLDMAQNSDNSHDHPHAVIRSSIGVLISPDEPDSPSRSRRRDYDRDPYQKMSLTEENHTPCSPQSPQSWPNNGHLNEMNSTHYEKSPETKRRSRVRKNTNPYLTSPMERHRSPSPIERRLVNKHDASAPAPVSSTVHKTRRKSSSDAGPVNPLERVKLPPERKVSSGARLQDAGLELPRKRKVSFDTTALYNGNAIKPLNDSTTAVSEMAEYYEDSNDDFIGEQGTNRTLSNLPTFVLSASDDELYDDSHQASSPIRKIPTEENLNANCFVNECFVNDEGDNHYDTSPPLRNHEYATIANRGQPASPSSYNPYVPNDTNHMQRLDSPYRNPFGHQKTSTSSLPAGLGYRNGSNTSLEPKSILKNRRDDSESVASEESLAMKNFKVRKDSIALFAGNRGDLAMQAVVEQRTSSLKCLNKDYFKQLWVDRRHIYEKYKLHILVLILFIFTFAFVIVGLHFHKEQISIAKQIHFDVKTRRLSLTDTNRNDTVWSTLGLNIPAWQQPVHCHSNYDDIDDRTCLKWKGYAQLDIVHYVINRTKCYNVTWQLEEDVPPHDCFEIGSSVWYGPTNISESQWPIKSSNFTFSVSDSKHYGSGTFSSAVEYYWLSSSGEAIILDSNFPLEINWNTEKQGKLCVSGKESGDFYYTEKAQSNKFSYSICNGIDIYDTHMMVRKSFFSPISALPERWLIEHPHWSSVWDSDTVQVNESLVKDLAEDINSYELTCSTIDIDGQWESMYGDLEFNSNLFSNVTDTFASASSAGCKVSLSVYPYFHFNSKNFQYGVSHGYFVKDVGKTVPALLKWQHGIAAMIDISNPQAQDWISSKLRKLITMHDIDAVRFTYGTSSWVPHNPVFYADNMNPNTLKHMFSDAFSSIGHVITQSTSQSQHLTGLIAITSSVIKREDRFCLKNIIPDILNLGLMGYPFVISDGFSADDKFSETDYVRPSRDLYVRWMQLSAFLPAMKYTIKPWVYDERVLAYAKNISSLHEKVITQSIYDSTNSILNGEPVIRPMWWVNPTDQNMFDIDDQFMITDKYMVAPILCEIQSDQDVTFRDIYVPVGIWRDLSDTAKVIRGGQWIKNYKVGQFEIPAFVKLSEYGESSS